MGNMVKYAGSQSEADNVVIMQVLIKKYESLKGQSSGVQLSNVELYRELERELERVAGVTTVGASNNETRKRLNVAEQAPEGFGASLSRTTESPRSKRTTILVVDDSHLSCKLATRALRQADFQAEVAYCGQAGLDILYQRPTSFDLVLLDIIMPDIDGIEVLKRMKQDPHLRSIPVAMLSGLEDQTFADVCLQQGAVIVLQKPMKVEEVKRVVERWCLKSPTSSDPGFDSSRSTPPAPPPPSVRGPANIVGRKNCTPAPEVDSEHQASSMKTPLKLGMIAPNFELLDEKFNYFRLGEVLARFPERKLLLAFFPAAFAEGRNGRTLHRRRYSNGSLTPPFPPQTPDDLQSGTNVCNGAERDRGHLRGSGILSVLRDHLEAIKETKTDVVGIGQDLPFTMAALSGELGLKFPLLSDPFLHLEEAYVGAYDLGLAMPEAFGRRDAEVTGHRVSHTGVIVLDGKGKCIYRWVAESNSELESSVTVNMPELLEMLRTSPPGSADSSRSRASVERPNEPHTCTPVRKPPHLSSNAPHPQQRTAARPSSVPNQHQHHQHHHHQQQQQQESQPRHQQDKLTILVVDDSTISSRLAVRKLGALGHDTLHADNGQTALSMLRSSEHVVNLVLSDVVMPVMDGVELLTIIKGDAELQHIPVVMLSGLEDEILGNVCLESGAAAVLFKPLRVNEVQALIAQQRISNRHSIESG